MRRPIASKRRPITYCRRHQYVKDHLYRSTEQKMIDLGQIYHPLLKIIKKLVICYSLVILNPSF